MPGRESICGWDERDHTVKGSGCVLGTYRAKGKGNVSQGGDGAISHLGFVDFILSIIGLSGES